jgi:membrane-bound lytic murein transglycosylase F
MALPIPRLLLVLLGIVLATAGCSRLEPPETAGELVVGVLDDPVHYQAAGQADASGFEADLVRAFAEELKLPVRFVPVVTPTELAGLVASGAVHFAAAAPLRPDSSLRYTASIRGARLLIAQREDALPIADSSDLADQGVAVLAGSPAAVELQRLAVINPFPIQEVRQDDDIRLLAQVAEGRINAVATDSAHLDVAANFFPELEETQVLTGSVAYAWAFANDDRAETLRRQADRFISRARQSGLLARLQDRYFGHIHRITTQGVTQFIEDMRSRLPRLRQYFLQAAATTGIDWRILAALAYQESHWDTLATSPTGVRGIMMLTEETADRLRVQNRLDPEESIDAGARYLADLINELPAHIGHPDRLWFALAAYNLGMGHLRGARQLAEGMKQDSSSWYEMKKVLPLMARPEYYERLKAGRARGGEAVILVENVRTYYDILSRFQPAYVSPLQTGLKMQ